MVLTGMLRFIASFSVIATKVAINHIFPKLDSLDYNVADSIGLATTMQFDTIRPTFKI